MPKWSFQPPKAMKPTVFTFTLSFNKKHLTKQKVVFWDIFLSTKLPTISIVWITPLRPKWAVGIRRNTLPCIHIVRILTSPTSSSTRRHIRTLLLIIRTSMIIRLFGKRRKRRHPFIDRLVINPFWFPSTWTPSNTSSFVNWFQRCISWKVSSTKTSWVRGKFWNISFSV